MGRYHFISWPSATGTFFHPSYSVYHLRNPCPPADPVFQSFQAYPQYPVIPRKMTVAKRLAQCLNPGFPAGVHQKTLDVYTYIFETIEVSEGFRIRGPQGAIHTLIHTILPRSPINW
jgi:Dopey, N-terminal